MISVSDMKFHGVIFGILMLRIAYSFNIGDTCTIAISGEKGKCLHQKDCTSGLDNPDTKQVCSSEEADNGLVCCIDEEESRRNAKSIKTERVSKYKCKEYRELVFGNEGAFSYSCPFQAVTRERNFYSYPAEVKEFPHVAWIGSEFETGPYWSCTGSLISEQFVLTSANCVDDKKKFIRLGVVSKINTTQHTQEFNVTHRITYPHPLDPTLITNIGLLKMDRPANLNPYVRPICLYTNSASPPRATISVGWDSSVRGNTINLRVLAAEIRPAEKCRTAQTGGFKKDIQICVSGDGLISSGDILQIYSQDVYCMYEQLGVAVISRDPGGLYDTVYASLTPYLDWIEKTVWGDSICTIERTGKLGKCRLLKNCQKALEELQNKQEIPQQCGVQGTQIKVCCES